LAIRGHVAYMANEFIVTMVQRQSQLVQSCTDFGVKMGVSCEKERRLQCLNLGNSSNCVADIRS